METKESRMGDAEQHRRIVECGHKLGVLFCTARKGSSYLKSADNDARFVRKTGGGARVLHVYVLRAEDGIWADMELERFLRACDDPARETVSMAHELGHALLEIGRRADGAAAQLTAADDCAERHDRIENSLYAKEAISPADADCLYTEEELAAWGHGARLLAAQGFIAWDRFRELCERSLASYENAIRPRCGGWSPPPLNFLSALVERDPPDPRLA
jgi:hypothetical protein